MKKADKGTTKREAMGDIYDIYYNNKDMKLLLDLLATSSGVAPALAVLTILDKVKIRNQPYFKLTRFANRTFVKP